MTNPSDATSTFREGLAMHITGPRSDLEALLQDRLVAATLDAFTSAGCDAS